MRVALVQKCPAKKPFQWNDYFKFPYDNIYLNPEWIDDLKAKDVVLDVDSVKSEYDLIILVGAEPFKYFTKISGGVTGYIGALIDDKYMPISNPAMMYFKPDARQPFQDAATKISTIVEFGAVDFNGKYVGIEDYVEAVKFLRGILQSPLTDVAIDTETTGLYPRNGYVLGISIANCLEEAAYISTDVVYDEVEELFQKIFLGKRIVFHNAKFDMPMLEYHLAFKFIKDYTHPMCFEDTMYAHYILDENSGHGLKDLAIKYTPLGFYDKPLQEFIANYCKIHKMKRDDFTYDLIPFDIISDYAAKDSAATIAIWNKFKTPLYNNDNLLWVYKNILIRGCVYLARMQDNGVPFCKEHLKSAEEVLAKQYQADLQALYEHEELISFEKIHNVRFNPNSVYHLRSLLFDICKLPVSGKLTGTGAESTDAEVLEELEDLHKIPGLILSLKKLGKLANTYIIKVQANLDRDGRLRTNFNLHTTTSGRLSSSGKLNMQQLPRDDKTVKGCIRARPGYKIVSNDLTTAEMYYAATLSGDKKLMAVFSTGGDFHAETAIMINSIKVPDQSVLEAYHNEGKLEKATRRCFVETFYPGARQAAKAISFGILYGAGPTKIADTAGISLSEAKAAIVDYFKTFATLRRWLDNSEKYIAQNGYILSFFGRKRRLINAFSPDKGTAAHEIRSGINFLVQSVASDANFLGAIDAQDELDRQGIDACMFALVHDSIVAEVREDQVDAYINIVRKALQKDRGCSIPNFPIGVDFGVGESYAEAG